MTAGGWNRSRSPRRRWRPASPLVGDSSIVSASDVFPLLEGVTIWWFGQSGSNIDY